MIYSLLIQTSPGNFSITACALEFAKALLQQNHSIFRIFFYGDGVLLGNDSAVTPQGEPDIHAEWRRFIEDQQIDAVVCIAAALKRGILDHAESQRYQKHAATLADTFDLSGLGQLIEAAAQSDKLITFA